MQVIEIDQVLAVPDDDGATPANGRGRILDERARRPLAEARNGSFVQPIEISHLFSLTERNCV